MLVVCVFSLNEHKSVAEQVGCKLRLFLSLPLVVRKHGAKGMVHTHTQKKIHREIDGFQGVVESGSRSRKQ
jgi:hypothetical protein